MKCTHAALCALVVLAAATIVRAEETRLPATADGLDAGALPPLRSVSDILSDLVRSSDPTEAPFQPFEPARMRTLNLTPTPSLTLLS